jgi:hypothetical protein
MIPAEGECFMKQAGWRSIGAAWFLLFALSGGMRFPGELSAAPLLILADTSGSMREPVEVVRRDWEGPESEADPEEKLEVPKIAVVRELLLRLTAALPETDHPVAVYRLRYISGNPDRYAVFLPPEPRELAETTERIAEDFALDYPTFNRRSAIGDALRQFDERVLSALEGPRKVILFSDGRETFYDLDRDREVWSERGAADSASTEKDEEMWGPLTETERLRRTYGGDLTLVTVYVEPPPEEESGGESAEDQAEDQMEPPPGRRLLTDMSDANAGHFLDGLALLEDITPLTDALAGGE